MCYLSQLVNDEVHQILYKKIIDNLPLIVAICLQLNYPPFNQKFRYKFNARHLPMIFRKHVKDIWRAVLLVCRRLPRNIVVVIMNH